MEKSLEVDDSMREWREQWKEHSEGFSNFQSRSSDVWIMTLPRSGTTWTQEMVWLLSNNLDYENAKKFPLEERFPELAASLFPSMWKTAKVAVQDSENPKIFKSIVCDTSKPSYQEFAKIPGSRFFKTHWTFRTLKNILYSGAKTIYVARDPKDRFLSIYRLITAGENPMLKCDMRQLWNITKADEFIYGPVWPHLKEGWAQRNNPNVLFLFYEEMKANLPATLKKMATFLGKSYTDEEIETLTLHLDIDYFRKNPMVNRLAGFESTNSCFIGGGKVGAYKDVIPPDIEKEIDDWIAENIRNSDFAFPGFEKTTNMRHEFEI